MKKPSFLTLALVLVLLIGPQASATTRSVPGDYPTIQAAIGASNHGDTVIVQPGRYYENINFLGKAITVQSTNPDDPNIVEATVIDANGSGNVVTFANGEGRDSVLQGFSITGGIGTEQMTDTYVGGGIYCTEAGPSILQNIITGNSVSGYGGGLFCSGWTHVLLYKNTIMGNSAKKGGGISTLAAQIEARNNVICHNTAEWSGGGIHLSQADYSTITENTIAANYNEFYGQYGANLHIQLSGNVTVTNNIIVNALLHGVGIYLSDSSIFFKYNNVWNNAGGNYRGMSDPTGIDGNISANPIFVDAGNYNYHLQVTSPCINAGDSAFIAEPGETDIDGEPRVMGGRIDIGADEFLVNLEPVADAGDDQTYSSIPSQVALDGSGSYDPFGDPLTSYHWRQINGPAVELSDPCVVGPTFVPSEFGIYVFELVVNDGVLDSVVDVVGIVIGNNHAPVADAGSSRYAGIEAITLDGTESFDPDGYGELSYSWQQVSGPTVVITDADTATPTISGFVQTSAVQECEFELIVNDGENDSLADTVEVIIVPIFLGPKTGGLGAPFDITKPIMIHSSQIQQDYSLYPWGGFFNNVFPYRVYGTETYKELANKLIVILSREAPDCNQTIQIQGSSGSCGLVMDIATYLNNTYNDPRYAINRVTLLDQVGVSSSDTLNFLDSRVCNEQCWIDNYISTHGFWLPKTLNIRFPVPPADHGTPPWWYWTFSFEPSTWSTNMYNNGLIGGAYISAIGPAKNLQLATNSSPYYFQWEGPVPDGPGYLDFYNETSYPGRLPEPVTLVDPNDGAVVDANGAVLSCEESENAVGYELLFGRDPYRVSRYMVISDTSNPPDEVITKFPFEKTYWTIKVRDQYGSTIYADPICIRPEHITPPTRVIENLTTGETYDHIQTAIDDAAAGDELVLRPGISSYPENIDFKGKKLTLRSIDPNDPNVVANTVINGGNWKPALTFANGEDTTCTVNGLTITGGSSGIHCSGTDTMPKITNCLVTANNGAGIELTDRGEAMIENCLITANSGAGVEQTGGGAIIENSIIAENQADGVQGTLARLMITNCTIAANAGTGIKLIDSSAKVTNCIIWLNSGVAIDFDEIIRVRAAYSNIQGGFPGDGNIDTDPCFAGPVNRDYHLQSEAGRWDANTEVWVTDVNTSPCIDAGDPSSDWTEELWPHGEQINMGAFGGTPQASMSLSSAGNIADLNDDHFVNWQDLKILADKWLHQEVLLSEDLDRNGSINFTDFAKFANHWRDLGILTDNWLAGL